MSSPVRSFTQLHLKYSRQFLAPIQLNQLGNVISHELDCARTVLCAQHDDEIENLIHVQIRQDYHGNL
jgi:hypothetical protein